MGAFATTVLDVFRMSSLYNNINVGSTGLRVASTGLNATSHNVANVNTEGYSRRTVTAATRDPVRSRGLLFGTGAEVSLLGRTVDRMVDDQLVTVLGQEASSEVAFLTLSAVEVYLDEDALNGPQSRLREFFDSLVALEADPSDPSRREQVLSAGSSLARSVRTTAGALTSSQDLIEDELDDALADINEKLATIAELNGEVLAGGGALSAGDFADQRDALIRDVAEDIGATVHFAASGEATVFLAGHAIVSGSHARELDITTGGGSAPTVYLNAGTASAALDVTADLGGRYGGLSEAWTTMEGYLTDLDTWVTNFATAFNTQHTAGFDQSGAAGGDFFAFTAGSEALTLDLDAALALDATLIAAAGAATAAAGDDANLELLIAEESALNHGGGTLTAQDAMSDIYAEVGRDVVRLQRRQESYEAQLFDLNELRTAISGVDLDEEAANLLQWQAAYEASARVISTTNELLDTLLALGR